MIETFAFNSFCFIKIFMFRSIITCFVAIGLRCISTLLVASFFVIVLVIVFCNHFSS